MEEIDYPTFPTQGDSTQTGPHICKCLQQRQDSQDIGYRRISHNDESLSRGPCQLEVCQEPRYRARKGHNLFKPALWDACAAHGSAGPHLCQNNDDIVCPVCHINAERCLFSSPTDAICDTGVAPTIMPAYKKCRSKSVSSPLAHAAFSEGELNTKFSLEEPFFWKYQDRVKDAPSGMRVSVREVVTKKVDEMWGVA